MMQDEKMTKPPHNTLYTQDTRHQMLEGTARYRFYHSPPLFSDRMESDRQLSDVSNKIERPSEHHRERTCAFANNSCEGGLFINKQQRNMKTSLYTISTEDYGTIIFIMA